MRFRGLVAATALTLAMNSCSAPRQITIAQQPLTEPPASLIIERKCKCAPPFSKLSELVRNSDIVLVGEVHSWAAHYADISSNLDILARLGVKKIFIELPVSLNKYVAEYQALRKQYLDPEVTEKTETAIIHKMAKVVESLAKELLKCYDPAKFGYLLALMDRATIQDIQVILVDTADDRKSISERDGYMASMVLSHLQTGKALWLGGIAHLDGMSTILKARYRVTAFNVLDEIISPGPN